MSAFQVHLAGTLSLQQIHFANLPVFNLTTYSLSINITHWATAEWLFLNCVKKSDYTQVTRAIVGNNPNV